MKFLTGVQFRLQLRSVITAALSIIAIGTAAEHGYAAAPENPDWPCIWRKTPQLDAAAIWDGPSIDDVKWRDNDRVRKLSEYLISRRVKLDDAESAVKKFAGEQSETTRDQALTVLFAAVLSRSNDERKTVMAGIERFHKRQMARAKEIEKEGLVLPPASELPTEPIPAGEIDKLSDAEEKYNWEVRIFQERQQNIPIACEIPQLIDERAGAIARTIRAEMKQ